ncbi:hypothetical protein [Schaalia vaccimaxillae]|uniref:hypothetical protein n=1 Tax=Schaalia vaccimaxillae TaxID=183916 RepID=UPI0003B6B4FF|nr:hypothetical protein [Schaalia vaccimaxillae]
MKLRYGTALLWSGPGCMQIGADPLHHVRLEGLNATEQQWLACLADSASHRKRGNFNESELLVNDPPRARQFEALLQDAGLVADKRHPRSVKIRIETATPASLFAICTLGGHLDISLAIADSRPVDADLNDALGGGYFAATRSAACYEFIERRRPETTRGFGGPADLVLVGGNRCIDPAITTVLNAEDAPQLLITRMEHGYEVGPLVIPGSTCCHLCVEAQRFAEDPLRLTHLHEARSWPLASAPLVSHVGAGVRIAALIEDWADGRLDTDDCQSSIWVGLDGSVEHTESHLPHRMCSCGASGVPFLRPVDEVA